MQPTLRSFYRLLFLCFLGICGYVSAHAQGYVSAYTQGLTISGRVVDEQKLPLPSATVFLSGTMRITPTDLDGKFSFKDLSPGSYIVTVKMLGYTPYFLNVTVRQNINDMVVEMKPNPTALNEVKIKGKDTDWATKYALFKQCFLGTTKNGRNCKITNPKVLRLKYENGKRVLKGTSDDFLIIENPELGYRVKYLIKTFEFNGDHGTTNYDGETSFEELPGTQQQKDQWQLNRRKAYYGSSMHFFRALYNDKRTPAREGFAVRGLTAPYELDKAEYNERTRPPVDVDPRPVKFDTIVTVIDNSFVSFSFKRDLFIKYNAKRGPLEMRSIKDSINTGEVDFTNDASIIQLSGGEAIIDSRGKVGGQIPFLMLGYWGNLRIGDQLPYEYRPDGPVKK